MQEGIVMKVLSNYVQVISKQQVYLCTLRGRLKKEKKTILTGDKVQITLIDKENAVVEEVLPRKSILKRPSIANAERVFVVSSTMRPTFQMELLDRMLAILEYKELEIVICINKSDLLDTMDETKKNNIVSAAEYYQSIGYSVFLTSCKDEHSIEKVREACQGKISVMAGPSGVGKSSLLNAVKPALDLPTNQVSHKSGVGRHTTRHVELLRVGEDGLMADSPGFGALSFDQEMDKRSLGFCFIDMIPYIPLCRFNSCLHDKEPDCRVKQAVEEKKIDARRYEHYLQFLEEIAELKRRY